MFLRLWEGPAGREQWFLRKAGACGGLLRPSLRCSPASGQAGQARPGGSGLRKGRGFLRTVRRSRQKQAGILGGGELRLRELGHSPRQHACLRSSCGKGPGGPGPPGLCSLCEVVGTRLRICQSGSAGWAFQGVHRDLGKYAKWVVIVPIVQVGKLRTAEVECLACYRRIKMTLI